MSESLEHYEYVRRIYNRVKELVPQDCVGLIKADLFGCEKPSLTYNSFVPDVMYQNIGCLIIGEAKTLDDFDRIHSYEQYESYVQECMKFPGETTLVICIPWQLFITAQNHFIHLKKKYNSKTKVIVMNEIGMEEIV